MFRRRHLGVREGNAIEDIVIYDDKLRKGVIPTPLEVSAYEAACQVVERLPVGQKLSQSQGALLSRDYENDGPAGPSVHIVSLKPLAWIGLGFIVWILLATVYHLFS